MIGAEKARLAAIFAAFATNCTARTESLSPLYNDFPRCYNNSEKPTGRSKALRQHRTIPALRLKHRSGSCGTASALPKCSIMSGCGTRIVLRGQKPLALCDRCPCFGSLFPPLAALTFAASSIICAFGLASAAPRSPYRHLELCGIALKKLRFPLKRGATRRLRCASALLPFGAA